MYTPGINCTTVTGKGHPKTGHEDPDGEWRYSFTVSLTLVLNVCGCSVPRSGRFIPGKDPVLILQEAGWDPGPFWTGADNLVPIGMRFPDRPACSNWAIPARTAQLYRNIILHVCMGVKLGVLPQTKTTNSIRHVHPVVLTELSSSWRVTNKILYFYCFVTPSLRRLTSYFVLA
jgi:hypothetical protein